MCFFFLIGLDDGELAFFSGTSYQKGFIYIPYTHTMPHSPMSHMGLGVCQQRRNFMYFVARLRLSASAHLSKTRKSKSDLKVYKAQSTH